MIVDENRIFPDEGKTLTNGRDYSKSVILGINDSVANWHEIDDADVPTEETAEAKAEAYDIIMGISV